MVRYWKIHPSPMKFHYAFKDLQQFVDKIIKYLPMD
jgi:hypothetical protein